MVVGRAGATGATGAQGMTGATGAQGSSLPGPAGARGDTGPSGIQGVVGSTGAEGPSREGPRGPVGATGATGAQGATGFTGSQGNTELAGVTGPAGRTGATGAQGQIGQTGAQGSGGSPSAAAGGWSSFRDFYFDFNQAELRSSDSSKVSDIANYLSKNPGQQVGIDGAGSSDLNNQRVSNVRSALLKEGVPAWKIQTGNFGNPQMYNNARVEALVSTR